MRHLWILNHYATPPSKAGGTRHFHLAKELQGLGWQTTIIAASVQRSGGEQSLPDGCIVRLEDIEGVAFSWVRTPKYRGNGGGRLTNMLAYSLRSLLPRTTRGLPRPDVIIGSSVHPFAALTGALLSARLSVPFVFEVRDLWPQTLVDMGRMKDGQLVTWILRKLEQWLYHRATKIVVLLPNAWEYIVPLGIAREKVEWIPNGVDLEMFSHQEAPFIPTNFSPFTLIYFGAHGFANGLDIVLQAMRLVKSRRTNSLISLPIRLRMIGDGPLKRELIEQAEEWGLDDVSFEPAVPKDDIPRIAAQADAFIIAVLDLPKLYRYGISMNKLYDYMAAGKPVLLASSAVNNPVGEAGAGYTVPANQPEALAEAIIRMAELPMLERQRMGRAGRGYVERYHGFKQLAVRLASTLENVCRNESNDT